MLLHQNIYYHIKNLNILRLRRAVGILALREHRGNRTAITAGLITRYNTAVVPQRVSTNGVYREE